MNKIFIGIIAILLCGCATQEYDHNAWASANAQQQIGMDRCDSQIADKEIVTASGLMNCFITVQSQFAVAVKLKQMAVFDAYKERLLLLGQQVDAGVIPTSELASRYAAIRDQFNDTISSTQASDNSRAAQSAAALRAFGAGMANAGAALQAATPPLPPPAVPAITPPVNCRTVFVANVAQTQCF